MATFRDDYQDIFGESGDKLMILKVEKNLILILTYRLKSTVELNQKTVNQKMKTKLHMLS